MGFPLGEWIDSHAGVRHNLAQSGMGPTLRTARAALRRLPPADPAALRLELARCLGVRAERLFLTHGATEGNAVVCQFVAHFLRELGNRAPQARLLTPEYPPLTEAARLAGFDVRRRSGPTELFILSNPNNPTGHRWSGPEIAEWRSESGALLIDETFREFTEAPSHARSGSPGLWTTGTFTKVFGGDAIRVGYVVAPPESVEGFAAFHGVLTDGLAAASVQAARALLRDRSEVLAEARRIFVRNYRALKEFFPDSPTLSAPLWFDRFDGPRAVDRLTRALLRKGVLICPGSYFGDPSGVRVCLTRRSFPDDLAVYRAVRSRGV